MTELLGRTLGVDFGSKRIGLAISDAMGMMAGPLTVIQVGKSMDGAIAQIARIAKAEEAVRLVVGMPFNMDGSEGPQADKTRAFAKTLGDALKLPVEFVDERLTSYAAESMLQAAELTNARVKARVDKVAAQILLQTWLEARRPK